MRCRHLLVAFIAFTGAAAADAAAQVTVIDHHAARAGVRVGTGGHGMDWEASLDSPVFADRIRLRAGFGQGRWDSEFDSFPNPLVRRLAGSAIVLIPTPEVLTPYVGAGISAYLPLDSAMPAQRGARVIGGIEGTVLRWTVGVEAEIDLPARSTRRPPDGKELFMVGRIGLALRRSF